MSQVDRSERRKGSREGSKGEAVITDVATDREDQSGGDDSSVNTMVTVTSVAWKEETLPLT